MRGIRSLKKLTLETTPNILALGDFHDEVSSGRHTFTQLSFSKEDP